MDPDDDGIVFRDVILLALLGFVLIVVLILPHVNPPGERALAASPPGKMIIHIDWPVERNADIDLWVKAPHDVPVGYSNKGSRLVNLLRDDLGHKADPSNQNYEVSYTRGLPDGEYVVNLHRYSTKDYSPIAVRIAVTIHTERARRTVWKGVKELEYDGEEITAIRFQLRDGVPVPASFHNVFKSLRAAQ